MPLVTHFCLPSSGLRLNLRYTWPLGFFLLLRRQIPGKISSGVREDNVVKSYAIETYLSRTVYSEICSRNRCVMSCKVHKVVEIRDVNRKIPTTVTIAKRCCNLILKRQFCYTESPERYPRLLLSLRTHKILCMLL